MYSSNDNLSLNNLSSINNSILDKTYYESGNQYNGKVNLMEPENPNIQFKMFEKIAIKNKATEYREALCGNWESNLLAQVYFSAENIQIVQNGLRAGVYNMSQGKYNIPPQNIDTLKIIMRSIYLQYAEHYENDITGQVEKLNAMVLDYAIPSVYSAAESYRKYCIDQSTLVVPLELPQQHDRVYKQLELKNWV